MRALKRAPLRALRLAVLALGIAAAGTVLAQGGGERGGGGAPGSFDFYVLALSWSPGYCETARRASPQCEPGRRLGFVVHGLWPQYERGFPSECGGGRFLPRTALDQASDLYPDEGLARHEWREHGTCSGLGPTEYFRAVREAREKVKIPDPLAEVAREGQTTPQAIERAFVEVNPGLRSDMIAVQCRRNALEEVRICMSRDLRSFRPCPEIDRRGCRFGPIRVSAPR